MIIQVNLKNEVGHSNFTLETLFSGIQPTTNSKKTWLFSATALGGWPQLSVVIRLCVLVTSGPEAAERRNTVQMNINHALKAKRASHSDVPSFVIGALGTNLPEPGESCCINVQPWVSAGANNKR